MDTHIHLYEPQGLDWLNPDNIELYCSHHAADYKAIASNSPYDRVILVEAGTTLEHNEWMLQHAAENELIAAVIGNLYLGSMDFEQHILRFMQNPKFRGIRNRAQGPVDYEESLVRQNLALMAQHNMVLETGVSQNSFKAIAAVAEDYPNLTIILNHMAGGVLNASGKPQPWWEEAVQLLSESGNVYCKLSMYDVAFRKDYSPERLNELFNPLLSAFGPNRILYGSNWPVTPEFNQMNFLFEASITEERLRMRILEENPAKAYRIMPE